LNLDVSFLGGVVLCTTLRGPNYEVMASGFPVLFALVITIGLMICSFLFVHRGPQQAYVLQLMVTCIEPTTTEQVATDNLDAHIRIVFSHVDGHIFGTVTSSYRYVMLCQAVVVRFFIWTSSTAKVAHEARVNEDLALTFASTE